MLDEVPALRDDQDVEERQPVIVSIRPDHLKGEDWDPRKQHGKRNRPQRPALKNREDLTSKGSQSREHDDVRGYTSNGKDASYQCPVHRFSRHPDAGADDPSWLRCRKPANGHRMAIHGLSPVDLSVLLDRLLCPGSEVSHVENEYHVDTPVVHLFIGRVLQLMAMEPRREWLVDAIRPAFADLLAAEGWLPDDFARPYEASKMGGGIGSYLLYRHGAALSLMALVVPAGAATPVHDHLAWGLVGLYRGEQDEEVYRRLDDGQTPGRAVLELVEQRHLKPGDFYTLLPPEGDIHRVRTTSSTPSISIHLLGNDVGCVWRHAYEPEVSAVREFRSGYANVECRE